MKYCSVADQIFKIIRRAEEEKKKPTDYGGGILLGHAEVQFLETAARYRDDRLRERRLLFYGTVRDATEKWLPGVARSRRPLDNNARSNKEGLSMRETPRV